MCPSTNLRVTVGRTNTRHRDVHEALVRQAQAVGISYMSLPTQNPADCSYAALRTIVGSERPENITFQGKRQKKSAMGRSVPKRWAQVDFTADSVPLTF